jgi:4-hydroxybenzoyl-CoA reductase subunit beta
VAGPQIRNMATLGGNVCLDTRCSYYNQTEFWRGALGYCIKKDGTICHVVPKGQKCVAAASADTPTALLVYGAKLRLVSRRGERWVDLDAFFVNDGIRNNTKAHDEILAAVALPPAEKGAFAAYHKFSLEPHFPLLIAVRQKTESISGEPQARGGCADGAPASEIEQHALGRPLTDSCLRWRKKHTSNAIRVSVAVDPTWRRDVVPVCVRRAFDELAPATAGGS